MTGVQTCALPIFRLRGYRPATARCCSAERGVRPGIKARGCDGDHAHSAVEDETELQELFGQVLRGEGYAVDIASTLADALYRLGAQRYALVVADWRLPDGNGIIAADRAAELGAKTIVISGYLYRLADEAAERHELLMKPVRPIELIVAVKASIGKPADP